MDTPRIDELGSCSMLLGSLLLQNPKQEVASQAIAGLCAMDVTEGWPFGTAEELGQVAALLGEAASMTTEQHDRAYHHLFVGPQELKAAPWGSVYVDEEDLLFGDSTILLVRWMKANGIALHESGSREPADHIGRMLVLLSWLCENDAALIPEFLEKWLLTWAPAYFGRLVAAADGEDPLYVALALLGSLTLRGAAKDFGLTWSEAKAE